MMSKLPDTRLRVRAKKVIEKEICRVVSNAKVKVQKQGKHTEKGLDVASKQTEPKTTEKKNNSNEIVEQKKRKRSLHSDGTKLKCKASDVLPYRPTSKTLKKNDLRHDYVKNEVNKNQSIMEQTITENKSSHNVLYIFNTLSNRLNSHRNPSKALSMSKYMRNQFEFFGLQAPERRALYKDLWAEVKKLNSSEIRALVNLTWQSPEREFQLFTTEILEKEMLNIFENEAEFSATSALNTLEFIKSFLAGNKSWWDTVDTLAVKVVGPLVKLCQVELLPVMDKWNIDDNFWLCRTSIIYQNSFKARTDEARLFKYCLTQVHSKEFFIQKAIGWALREYYKINPMSVTAFVKENKDRLSSLSIREALKHDK
ncbi:hypothetical protein BgiMline_009124 [Biomphalaria glabrata]|nr:DNA alkylation repair protein [Biomphalaria glabrata]